MEASGVAGNPSWLRLVIWLLRAVLVQRKLVTLGAGSWQQNGKLWAHPSRQWWSSWYPRDRFHCCRREKGGLNPSRDKK